jgi:hypothetical protein
MHSTAIVKMYVHQVIDHLKLGLFRLQAHQTQTFALVKDEVVRQIKALRNGLLMMYATRLSCEESITIRALMTIRCSKVCKTKLPTGVFRSLGSAELSLDSVKILRVLFIVNRFSQRTFSAYFDGLLHAKFVNYCAHLVVELSSSF